MAIKKNPLGDGPHAGPVAQGFGMPQALVILGFLTAAVVLRLVADTSVQDTVVLLTVAGGVSVPVMLAAGSRRSGRRTVRRLLDAVLTPGSGN